MYSQTRLWHEAMLHKGHKPRMADWSDDPMLDIFFTDSGFHNGPGCDICGWTCCMHCEEIDDIPVCIQTDGENK